MAVDRPPPGEELNPGEPTRPRSAATVLLLRDARERLEVLLVQRNPAARFMGGMWVFPGGAVDAREGEGDAANRRAAIREVEEETGVRLRDPAALVPVSRWVTPAQFRIRFDTVFFLAALPPGEEPRIDGHECVDHGWFRPADALESFRAGRIKLVLPTIHHLELLAGMDDVDDALESMRGRRVERVEPRIVGSGEEARVLLPGEAGWET